MKRFFSADGALSVYFSKIWEVVVLSVLWVVCSLPIVTMGAATTALYFVMLRMHAGEYSLFKDFFRSFKENFFQGFVAGLVAFVFYAGILFGLWAIFHTEFGADLWAGILIALGIFLLGSWCSWVFPTLAKFNCTWFQLMRTPIVMAVIHFIHSITSVLLNVLPLLLLALNWRAFLEILPLMVLLVPGTIAYINSAGFNRDFQDHIPAPAEPEEAAQDDSEAESEE